MKTFDNPLSPYARKVRLVLREKGLEFEKHEILRHGDRAELLRVNPRAEVPALQDGEMTISDSSLICAYLEDRYPAPALLPADPVARARCRWLEKVSDSQIDAVGVLVFLSKFARPDMSRRVPETAARVEREVRGVYSFLDRELPAESAEIEFSIADAALLPHVTVMAFAGYAIDADTPRLAAWLQRLGARPAVRLDQQEAMAAYEASQKISDPIFDNNRLHWRSDRIEAAVRLGLGPWLLEELAADRAFLPPPLA